MCVLHGLFCLEVFLFVLAGFFRVSVVVLASVYQMMQMNS